VSWFEDLKKWKGLKGFGMMETKRMTLPEEKTTSELHFYITSFGGPDVKRFAHAARGQWSIEVGLHWRLDVQFNEDKCQIRTGHAAENFSILRHIAINLLKQAKSEKRGIKARRKRCGWDRDYLLEVLGFEAREPKNP